LDLLGREKMKKIDVFCPRCGGKKMRSKAISLIFKRKGVELRGFVSAGKVLCVNCMGGRREKIVIFCKNCWEEIGSITFPCRECSGKGYFSLSDLMVKKSA
jgi:tRNA-binding EMAP/Myf-like protein